MLVRIISAVVALPILIILMILGGVWLQCGVAAVSVVGLYEFYRAVNDKIKPVHFIGFVMAVVYTFMLNFRIDLWISVFINVFVVLVLIMQVAFYKKINIHDVAAVVFGFFYIVFTMGNIYVLRSLSVPFADAGMCFVWLIFISAWCCDTGAYFTGKLIGKHKLAPELSPKKTIEGAVGGIIWAGAGGALYGLYINCGMLEVSVRFADAGINIVYMFALICAVSAVLSQFGDLAASAVKRYTGIKDYGTIMPGHGGVMDRFDSVFFTSAAVYVLVQIIVVGN